MYLALFLARFFPFWALPAAFVFFELGMFYYYRRVRGGFYSSFIVSLSFVILSVLWIVFEGYWRAGPWVKKVWENFGQ